MVRLPKAFGCVLNKTASTLSLIKSSILCLWLVVLCLLVGCEPSSARQQAVDKYSTGNHPSQYAELVTKDADTLDTKQLYNRALTLWGEDYTELGIPTSYGVAQVVVSGPADGYPLVLLHGMNTNSTMWYPNAAGLARHYQIYAIDYLLGPGKSEPNETVDDVAQVLAWYSEVFDQLELNQFALAGASQGGWFATQIALDQPSRVSHLVLLSAAQTFSWIDPSVDLLKNMYFALNPERSGLREMLQTMSVNVDNIDQLYIDQFYRYSSSNTSLPKLLIEMKPFDDETLAKLNMPTLVLIGDQDIINSPDSLERARQLLPCVKTAIVADAGHFVNVDNAERVNKEIHRFIGSNGGESDGCNLPSIKRNQSH
ncbi:alpha/beta fold hydrolase [Gilvimarinus polysaccharolyticus]|uniref:alpha/beta fold hydrolase n=1 Tax=Gilvimarinus polysaccharolyticus TaxID=863921 RepID=UPI000673207F|nr:alpha/beta hydrolase [Gilvimarinus polysaccharolyticus]